jgi:hypothetical protein
MGLRPDRLDRDQYRGRLDHPERCSTVALLPWHRVSGSASGILYVLAKFLRQRFSISGASARPDDKHLDLEQLHVGRLSPLASNFSLGRRGTLCGVADPVAVPQLPLDPLLIRLFGNLVGDQPTHYGGCPSSARILAPARRAQLSSSVTITSNGLSPRFSGRCIVAGYH